MRGTNSLYTQCQVSRQQSLAQTEREPDLTNLHVVLERGYLMSSLLLARKSKVHIFSRWRLDFIRVLYQPHVLFEAVNTGGFHWINSGLISLHNNFFLFSTRLLWASI